MKPVRSSITRSPGTRVDLPGTQQQLLPVRQSEVRRAVPGDLWLAPPLVLWQCTRTGQITGRKTSRKPAPAILIRYRWVGDLAAQPVANSDKYFGTYPAMGTPCGRLPASTLIAD